MNPLTTEIARKEPVVRHSLDDDGAYRIDHYDRAPSFASFLPGIAGPDGVPMWCMYVNRGQGVVSFGTGGKDGAILEFLPATWAYQLVAVQGFRTFLKVDGQYFEPFQRDAASLTHEARRTLWIEPDSLTLQERNTTMGISVRVSYFSVVGSSVPALVRRTRITNLAETSRTVQILDGLPLIQPAGFTDFQMKKMRRLSEAYACARPIGGTAAFYSARVRAHDAAEVEEVEDGHFYAARTLDSNGSLTPVMPLVDPDIVFGQGEDFVTPRAFLREESLNREAQVWENRLGCALVPLSVDLGAGTGVELFSLIGKAPSAEAAESFLHRYTSETDFDRAREDSRALMREITRPAFTVSANPFFDAYCAQNYLDNALRGGVPMAVPSRSGETLLHLYSRRHGDLERDYNDFHLAPHPLSDGPGNFRDVCQNRRSDIWFYPEVYDSEIRMFASLLQADGYNPLDVRGRRHFVPDGTNTGAWCPSSDPRAKQDFEKILCRPFSPGELLAWADNFGVSLPDRRAWLDEILEHCDTRLLASGHEGGYWIDHWTYIVDLLEAFQGVYPDRVQAMLTEQADIGWFDEGAFVESRAKKYQRRLDGPMQIEAVSSGVPNAEDLPSVTLLAKFVTLLAVKGVSLDYDGIGIEMEAGRPGWNDALNGLPGLFGSSTCEAAEALRLAQWLLDSLDAIPSIELPEIVAKFIVEAANVISGEKYDWNRASSLREEFREALHNRTGKGKTATVAGEIVGSILRDLVDLMRRGLDGAIDPKTGLIHTYYSAESVAVTPKDADVGTNGHVEIESFDLRPLPLYLEGQVHLLRTIDDKERARFIHRSIRNSSLYDSELAMYKLNEWLKECSPKIGRARTFSRGWFENESIWLHMSYKYLLELFRKGLYDEFFANAETMLVPFMDPVTYGRSILENSSFIASSDCPDLNARGRGFVARLSGTTAEFIQIWLLATLGPQPFVFEGDRLHFRPLPVLPAGWFTEKAQIGTDRGAPLNTPANAFACSLLGKSLLIYHNESRRDTFGDDCVGPSAISLEASEPKALDKLTHDEVERIRNREIARIDIWLR